MLKDGVVSSGPGILIRGCQTVGFGGGCPEILISAGWKTGWWQIRDPDTKMLGCYLMVGSFPENSSMPE
jgi:hypothetical protein